MHGGMDWGRAVFAAPLLWVLSGPAACSDPDPEEGAGGAAGALVRPGDPVDETTLARGLVAANSCFWDDGYYRSVTSFRGRQGGYRYPPTPLGCLANVTDGCRGVARCLGMEVSGGPAEGDATCDGNTAVLEGARWHCEQIGAKCRDGTCLEPGDEACDEATFEASCDAEGRPATCDDRVHVGPRCARFGLECVATQSEAGCVGTGGTCDGTLSYDFDVDPVGLGCAGETVLEACVSGGLADIECSELGEGFTCQEANGAFFCGLGSECDPKSFGQPCEGDTVTVCDAGRIVRVDCTSLGFPGCHGTGSMACAGEGTL